MAATQTSSLARAVRRTVFSVALEISVLCGGTVPVRAQSQPDAQTPDTQTPSASAPQAAPASSKPVKAADIEAQELANQANNPAAPLTLIQFRNILLPSVPDTNGVTNGLQMQPVLPIGPFHSFPWVQLVKITFPFYLVVPGSASGVSPPVAGTSGIGDIQIFDLISVKQSWGRWGFGPALVFPTASDPALGAGKWQAGPAGAAIFTGIKNLTAGAVVQNQFSYAGSPDRQGVNQMLITPTLTYNMKDGWFVGLSDYNWTFNWEKSGAATIPLGLQVGRVFRLGKQPLSLSVEAGGTAARPANTPSPGWILGFELSPIFNFHIGPGEKIRLRGKN
jgi:hypothetical protein